MSRKRYKPRSTPRKRIEELAKQDSWKAMRLAERGKQFSEVEEIVWWHFQCLERLQRIKSGEEQEFFRSVIGADEGLIAEMLPEAQKAVQWSLDDICRRFISALNGKDSEKLFEFAKAVDLIKYFKPTDKADKLREKILMEAERLRESGKKITLKHLAKLVGWPETDSYDGFSGLRQIAKPLGVPIENSSVRRNKE